MAGPAWERPPVGRCPNASPPRDAPETDAPFPSAFPLSLSTHLCGNAAICRCPTAAPSGCATDLTSAPLWHVCSSTLPSPAPDAARSRSAEMATAEIARTWPRRYRRGRGVTQCLGLAGGASRQRRTVVSSAPVRRRVRERAIQLGGGEVVAGGERERAVQLEGGGEPGLKG